MRFLGYVIDIFIVGKRLSIGKGDTQQENATEATTEATPTETTTENATETTTENTTEETPVATEQQAIAE